MPNCNVFISLFQGDRPEVADLIARWAIQEGVFTPKVLGVSSNGDFIDSDDPEFVMSRIREKYLGDSTVTIVLVGSCTHNHRYVDWEIKASLCRGSSPPNGLIGIALPSTGNAAYLPPRLEANWISGHQNCYSGDWTAPTSAWELALWIEDAFSARTSRADLIQNPSEMMKYNRECRVHGVTHRANRTSSVSCRKTLLPSGPVRQELHPTNPPQRLWFESAIRAV